ncbi:2Fe-2S iron-sulfur cluster binding domain-containing protein [Nocardioides albidus]|uniref:2Fe-2S iron-sulfur cluster binding domain-containing protein n=1 Tax=Nocardioides albidus TaxID=1517589 RepID=A0A5C4VTX8_9ACTN|nr:2Fe-2S iron-sulfur cluster-binding protein [Nocardioides albidus]TNM38649.1 2Fe-2S iron-sulfur cluster binding domain-containing protein [Nocardioides albidus]
MSRSEVATRTFQVRDGETRRFDCTDGDTLLRAALRAGVPATYECNSGGCGSCKFTLSDGEVRQVQESPAGLTERDRRKGRLLACQSVPTSDCTVSLLVDPVDSGLPAPVRRRAEIVDARMLTHDLRELTISIGVDATFLPGQFAMLRRPDGEERAYSMSNLPGEGVWQIQIKRVPGGAESGAFVDDLGVGDRIEVDGPYGHAHFRPTGRDVVCIAGGSGLAPMVSVARGLAASDGAAERRLHFFYGGRAARDLCAGEFVAELAGELAEVTLVDVISDEVPPDWAGARGFVHEAVATAGLSDLADRDIYVAGPPPMTDAVVRLLVRELQVPVGQIHYDRFF